MYIEFDKEYLQELYEQGKTGDKKHRYQPEIVRGYFIGSHQSQVPP